MAYLEAHQTLINHPKTKKAARLLGVTRPALIGHLFMLWSWCMDYAPDGDVTDVDWQDVTESVDWLGEPEVFKEALIAASVRPDAHGFLELTGDGRILIHDWHEYAGKLIAIRVKDAIRKRESRVKDVRRTSDGCPSDVQGMSDVAKQSKANTSKANTTQAHAVRSADEMASEDSAMDLDQAIYNARTAEYSKEEIDLVVASIKRSRIKVGSWASLLPIKLRANRDKINNQKAPPVEPFIAQRFE